MDDPSALPAAGAAPAEPAWRFLIRPRWLGWHLLMVVSFWGMLWLGDWQLHRPLFAGFAVVFWAKTIRDEFRIRRGQLPAPGAAAEPAAGGLAAGMTQVSAASAAEAAEADDDELRAYNAYLARLHAEVKRHGRWHGLR